MLNDQPLGLSFSPTGSPDQKDGQGGTPIQDAIKVLSLQMPRFSGGLSPQMGGMGSGGIVGGGGMPGGLEQFLAALFGRLLPMGPGAMAPNVMPGIQGPGQPQMPPEPMGGFGAGGIVTPRPPTAPLGRPGMSGGGGLPLNPPIETPPYGMPGGKPPLPGMGTRGR